MLLILTNPVICYFPGNLLHTNHIWQCWVSPTHVHAVSGDLTQSHPKTLVFRDPSEINIYARICSHFFGNYIGIMSNKRYMYSL